MRRSPPLLAPLLLATAVGCASESTVLSPRCDLTLGAPAPSPVQVGQTVTLPAAPLTSSWDTAVYVGGARATVLEVSREGCDDCDECREAAGCTACGDCDACDRECSQSCVETVQFAVPDSLGGGAWPVWVYNLHGTGGPATLEIQSPPDTGADDTGKAPDDTGKAPDDTGKAPDDTGKAPDDTGKGGTSGL
ncbi:hypothetical protein L6R53_30330 [Myxococcota bacterium]|nr:hypothetical protein [Myxococcota bacterium]